jgi:hypothetical protein
MHQRRIYQAETVTTGPIILPENDKFVLSGDRY